MLSKVLEVFWWEKNPNSCLCWTVSHPNYSVVISKSSVSGDQQSICGSLTLSVSSNYVLHLLSCSRGKYLHQNLLICSCPLQVKRGKCQQKTNRQAFNRESLKALNQPHVWYLDGISKACHVIGERRSHKSHDQRLEFTAQLSLQVVHQVLTSWRTH